MFKRSSFRTDLRAETFASLISCVIDNALLKAMSDIDQALLQFPDVMNLLDPLLHLSPYFVVNRVQIYAVG